MKQPIVQGNQLHKFEFWLCQLLIALLIFTIINDHILDYDPILLATLLVAVYLYIRYRKPFNFGKETRKIIWLFGFYYGYFLLHILITAIFYGLDERGVSLISKALVLTATCYLLSQVNVSIFTLKKIASILCIAVIFTLIYELFYYSDAINAFVTQQYRLGEVVSNIGEFGWIAGTAMLLAISFTLYSFKYLSKKLSFSLIALCFLLFLTVILSGTRSYWLGLPILGCLLLYITISKQLLPKRLLMALATFLLVGFTVTLFTDNLISHRVEDFKQDLMLIDNNQYSGSIGERLQQYQASIKIIKEHFWWGIGDINYRQYFTKYNHVHNHSLMDQLNRGILGLILSIATLLLPLYWKFKTLKKHWQQTANKQFWYSLFGLIFMLSSIVYYQFGAILYYSHGLLFFWLTLFITAMAIDHEDSLTTT